MLHRQCMMKIDGTGLGGGLTPSPQYNALLKLVGGVFVKTDKGYVKLANSVRIQLGQPVVANRRVLRAR